MGNSMGSKKKKTVKIMKIDGETMKLKTPVQGGEVVNKYPGYVLLESEDVKHFGTRAKPLDLQQVLDPKRLYFLVELPKAEDQAEKGLAPPRRVRSGIHMNAKDRLESLKLARRSTSDLSLMKQTTAASSLLFDGGSSPGGSWNNNNNNNVNVGTGSAVRLKLRLPKAEVARLMQESQDEAEAAQKIMDLCLAKNHNSNSNLSTSNEENIDLSSIGEQQVRMKSGHETQGFKKRVSFMPVTEGEIQLAMGAGPGIESW